MSNIIKVGMADMNWCKPPDGLTTLGLGSCVGAVLYDPVTKISGMAHVMLPDSTKIRNNQNRAKFADTCIQDLYHQLIKQGAMASRLVAKIAGGAQMFAMAAEAADMMHVGDKNIAATKLKLKELGIRLISEDTGLNYGRTIIFDSETGNLTIKSVGKSIKTI